MLSVSWGTISADETRSSDENYNTQDEMNMHMHTHMHRDQPSLLT
jgi:hypothetical protein